MGCLYPQFVLPELKYPHRDETIPSWNSFACWLTQFFLILQFLNYFTFKRVLTPFLRIEGAISVITQSLNEEDWKQELLSDF